MADTSFETTLFAAGEQLPVFTNISDLAKNYDQIKALSPGALPIRNGYVDPGESIKYTREVLLRFSKAYFPKDQQIPGALVDFVATAGNGNGVGILNPGLSALSSVANQITGTDFIDNAQEVTGFAKSVLGGRGLKDFSIDKVNTSSMLQAGLSIAESVVSGLVSPDDARAAAVVSGAFAGAAMGLQIGMAYGPIGAAVGLIVGAVIGALTGLFSDGPPPPPPEIPLSALLSQQKQQEAQYVYETLRGQRDKVLASCQSASSAYWTSLDKFFGNFSTAWANEETKLGFKFGLRWFDDAQGPAFYLSPYEYARMGMRWGIQYNQPTAPSAEINEANFRTYVLNNEAVTHCMLPMVGCPYPNMTGFGPHYPKGVDPWTKRPMFSQGHREAKAFAARGLVWVPPEMRLNCDNVLPHPTADYLYSGQNGINAYLSELRRRSLEIQVAQAHAASSISMLQLDLTRTAGVMRTYINQAVNRSKYQKVGLSLSDGQLADQLEKKSNLLNNTALLAGLGVLGYSAWRLAKR